LSALRDRDTLTRVSFPHFGAAPGSPAHCRSPAQKRESNGVLWRLEIHPEARASLEALPDDSLTKAVVLNLLLAILRDPLCTAVIETTPYRVLYSRESGYPALRVFYEVDGDVVLIRDIEPA
jgi:hypothetical protein